MSDSLLIRESHVYAASKVIMNNCHWLKEHDALEVSELLYSEGLLAKTKVNKNAHYEYLSFCEMRKAKGGAL
jgi:hypothetical protein